MSKMKVTKKADKKPVETHTDSNNADAFPEDVPDNF